MLSFKKAYRDEILQLALILSLLRCNSESFYDSDQQLIQQLPIDHLDLENGTSWRSLTWNALHSRHVHAKNFDSVLLNYEREMFADINSLGRYNRYRVGAASGEDETIRRPNITAYLLNVERTSLPSPVTAIIPQEPSAILAEPTSTLQTADVTLQLLDPLVAIENISSNLLEGNNEISFDSGIELTQEDMDLIEVLWKQDVDLGFSLDIQQQQQHQLKINHVADHVALPSKACEDSCKSPDSCSASFRNYTGPKELVDEQEDDDNNEKLNTLKEINDDKIKLEPGPHQDSDPWAGLDYTIDTETGEYVIKGELEVTVSLAEANGVQNCDALDDLSLPLPEFLLEDALQLVGIDDDISDISQNASNERTESSADANVGERVDESVGSSDAASASEKALADPEKKDSTEQPEPGSIASALLSAASQHPQTTTANQALDDGDDADDADDDDDDDLRLFDTMIQTSQFHHPHHSRVFQSRMPFVRAVSIEQHWQDLANLLSMPPGHPSHPSQQLQHQHNAHSTVPSQDSFAHHHHHHHHHQYSAGPSGASYHLQTQIAGHAGPHPGHHPGHHHHMGNIASSAPYCASDAARNPVLLHNATLNPPIGELNGTGPATGPGIGPTIGPAIGPAMSMASYANLGGTNLGNAVATSMNLTNSSEPMGDSGPGPHYKLEPTHDLMFYQNTSSELNQTDGLLSSILNDEDLQLMDMAMNEGMYTMRMLDGANTSGANQGSSPQAQAQAQQQMSATSSAASTQSSVSGRAPLGLSTDMDRLDTSSDSAVSSMGSERVPSLSDGEWGDAGSDSGHTAADHYVTDYQRKFGPYDYSYASRQQNVNAAETTRCPPVAQKKHQMYGKRYFQDQGNANLPLAAPATAGAPGVPTTAPTPPIPIKYEYRNPCIGIGTTSSSHYHPHQQHITDSATAKAPLEVKYYGHASNAAAAAQGSAHGSTAAAATGLPPPFGGHHHSPLSLDHIQHNHTYHLPVVSSMGAMQRPVSRDKSANGADKVSRMKKAEEEHLTRDEKRARALSVPISVEDIINLPMDEFNERLSKYDLSETQLSLIRDIRRRGKNKVAAQNCRKRKLDQILTLADEVKEMRDRKIRLINDHAFVTTESVRIKEKYQQLYRHVFQNLRDSDGNHYSPYQYSLQTSADGSILVVPLSNTNNNLPERKEQQPPPKD